MKKTSILLIALSLFAMIFSSCSLVNQFVPEKTTATIEDFQGDWLWSYEDKGLSSQGVYNPTYEAKAQSIVITVEGERVSMLFNNNESDKVTFSALMNNGYLIAQNTFFGTLQMSIKMTKTMITVTSEKLLPYTGTNSIQLTRKFDTADLPFIPTTQATFADYEGEWKNNEKGTIFTFSSQSITGHNINMLNVAGFGSEGFPVPGIVIVAKGVATTKVQDNTYVMYMNKGDKMHPAKTLITVTGPTIKNLTGSYYFNLEKMN